LALELNTIVNEDSLTYLQSLPSDSIHCMVTSPPYWGLRDYGIEGQLGSESTIGDYIETMVTLFREARRVLRSDGTLWLNMGDSYATTKNGRSAEKTKEIGKDDRTFRDKPFSTIGNGLKRKDLVGQPWRLALALQGDGWYLRSDIIWHKPNPMPESVKDRPGKSHEYVFLLTKSARYWYDAFAVREPAQYGYREMSQGFKSSTDNGWRSAGTTGGANDNPAAGRNKRTVWTVATKPFSAAHFATFPPKLITPMILAGCPPKVCADCGAPYERSVEKDGQYQAHWAPGTQAIVDSVYNGAVGKSSVLRTGSINRKKSVGWQPTCDHNTETQPGIVLDMFMGAGTVALVAQEHKRNWAGCELNPEYIKIANERIKPKH